MVKHPLHRVRNRVRIGLHKVAKVISTDPAALHNVDGTRRNRCDYGFSARQQLRNDHAKRLVTGKHHAEHCRIDQGDFFWADETPRGKQSLNRGGVPNATE